MGPLIALSSPPPGRTLISAFPGSLNFIFLKFLRTWTAKLMCPTPRIRILLVVVAVYLYFTLIWNELVDWAVKKKVNICINNTLFLFLQDTSVRHILQPGIHFPDLCAKGSDVPLTHHERKTLARRHHRPHRRPRRTGVGGREPPCCVFHVVTTRLLLRWAFECARRAHHSTRPKVWSGVSSPVWVGLFFFFFFFGHKYYFQS